MSAIVNTNVNASVAQQALTVNQRGLEKSVAQLATGQRINSAADDAAGLAISNKLSSQIRSLDMAVRNANDGISMLQTADGATREMTGMLMRMRDLAVQSANDTNSQTERDALQLEFAELQAQTGQIISNTRWNGMKLLEGQAGTGGTVHFQVGAQGTDSVTLPLSSMDSNDIADAIDGTVVNIASQGSSQAALTVIDDALRQIDTERSRWGAVMNRLTHAADNASNVSLHSSASRSRIVDADYAQATADLARSLILNQAGTAMLSQANQQPYYVLALLS